MGSAGQVHGSSRQNMYEHHTLLLRKVGDRLRNVGMGSRAAVQ
jgi:hypothetical protein